MINLPAEPDTRVFLSNTHASLKIYLTSILSVASTIISYTCNISMTLVYVIFTGIACIFIVELSCESVCTAELTFTSPIRDSLCII